MAKVTFLPARGVGTAVPEPSWKASARLEAHAANSAHNHRFLGVGHLDELVDRLR